MHEKKIIVYLTEFKVRKYDIQRLDINEFESFLGYKTEVHELIDYIHPGFSSMFTNQYQDIRIKSFSSLKDWKERMHVLEKNFGRNILIVNLIPLINFKCLMVNYFIKKNRFKTIVFRNISIPIFNPIKDLKYLLKFLKKNFFSFKKLSNLIMKVVLNFIAKRIKLFPNYLIVFGEKDAKKMNEIKNTKIIFGHSFDYNMHLKYKNIDYDKENNYGLFLESAAPTHNLGDYYVENKDEFLGTREKWLNSVNNFLDIIEKEFNIRILIIPHPKIKHLKKFSTLYNGREVIQDGLYLVSKKAKVIIARSSAGFSYAVINKIPAIFIHTNELMKNERIIKDQEYFASCMGTKPVNIDKNISKENLEKFLSFDEKIYDNYLRNYLSTRKDEKKNFEIIKECVSKQI